MVTYAPRHRREGGQALVLMVFGLIAMLVMAGVIVDGGNAFAHQRQTQNAADAAAYAGGTVVLNHLAGASVTDTDVASAIARVASTNGATINSKQYVDFGRNVVGTVGSGSIPDTASGVRVSATESVGTYISNVVGVSSINTSASATVLAGKVAQQGISLPVTFSVNMETCDGSGWIQIGSATWPVVTLETANASNEVILPLCENGAGGFGWLDLGCSGSFAQTIANGCSMTIDVGTTWIHTNTGNTNSVGSTINSMYDGKVLALPLFDGTCRSVPASGLLGDCTNPGNGSNLYYHIPMVVGFKLDYAYIDGNNHPQCNSAPGGPPIGGNGSNGCLKGWLVWQVASGEITSCGGPTGPVSCKNDYTALGLQLVQ